MGFFCGRRGGPWGCPGGSGLCGGFVQVSAEGAGGVPAQGIKFEGLDARCLGYPLSRVDCPCRLSFIAVL